ncbi:MAG: hypothetical protein A2Y84_01855 [Candidatus Colwellbacteria bacterium RBG_13_48_8]|uniref:Small ribosomal subunit protein bS6 n=1 Tax=Candidatus Colwellbacteria bacterium RBG_13_48_8 TaxID=1797685 RepID=A0A1G1YVZ1_9BACT|nr:MAG: hypothetical protein A2Y84_01855 [Candidatus Colwellbacteria bacterium RBG_13_48_8]
MKQEQAKSYEISFLAHGEEAVGAVIKHLSQLGAEILGEEKIEQITLAYPIKKYTTAHFGCIRFSLNPDDVKSLKDTLKFEEGILRYLIVTPPIFKEESGQPKKSKYFQTDDKSRETFPPAGGAVSNEALEAKLEELSGSLAQEEQ